MLYSAKLSVAVDRNEYTRLLWKGRRMIRWWKTRREGLRMLLAIRPLGLLSSNDDRLIWEIANAFRWLGYHAQYQYYLQKLYFFYPQSPYIRYIPWYLRRMYGFRHQVNYLGKEIPIKHVKLCDERCY